MRKATLQETLDTFPEEVDLDAFMEKAYLLQKIEIGERQIEAGEVLQQDEVKQRLEKWLA